MLSNLTGWHFLILLGVFVAIAVVVVAIIAFAVFLSRKNTQRPTVVAPDPAEQIEKLAGLRDKGLLSEAEYESKRSELLGRI